MPWCEDCSRFWNPNTMNRDGSCPTCGRLIAPPARVPWHFWLLLVALVLYLGYRAWQGFVLAAEHGLLAVVLGVLAASGAGTWVLLRRRRRSPTGPAGDA